MSSAVCGTGWSQEVANAEPTEPSDKFVEAFDPTSAVSGGVVVGVRLGEFDGNVDVDNIQLGAGGDQPFCVRAVTGDGRFSSTNKYMAAKAGAVRLRIQPITKAYAKILSAYPAGDLAVEAFFTESGECVSRDAIHLAQVQTSRRTSNVLAVLINASSRTVTMRDTKSGNEAKCTPVKSSTRIAYDNECAIDVSASLGKIAVFLIGLDDGFGVEEQKLKVSLPHETEAGAK